MNEILAGALYAAGSSSVAAFSFYMKNSSKESMDYTKLVYTVATGAAVGALSVFFPGIEPGVLQGTAGTIVGLVGENVFKAVRRRKK